MRPRISQISPPVEAVQTEQPKVATTTLDGPETVSELLLSRSILIDFSLQKHLLHPLLAIPQVLLQNLLLDKHLRKQSLIL